MGVSPLPAGFRWPSDVPWPVGVVAGVSVDELAARYALRVRESEEGEYESPRSFRSAACLLPSGVGVCLEGRSELNPPGRHSSAGPVAVYADAADLVERSATAIFTEALAALGLGPEHVERRAPPGAERDAAEALERVRAERATARRSDPS